MYCVHIGITFKRFNVFCLFVFRYTFHYIFAGREGIFKKEKKRGKIWEFAQQFSFWRTNQTGTLARLPMTFAQTKI